MSSKRFNPIGEVQTAIDISRDMISTFCFSAQIICVIHCGEEIFYFREIKPHTKKTDYFSNAIEEFRYVAQEKQIVDNFGEDIPVKRKYNNSEVDDFMGYLQDRLTDNGFVDKLSTVDVVSKRIGFSPWNNIKAFNFEHLSEIGLDDLPSCFSDIVILFLCYMKAVAATYRLHNRFVPYKWETISACRSISSSVLSRELRMPQYIADAIIVQLNIRGG